MHQQPDSLWVTTTLATVYLPGLQTGSTEHRRLTSAPAKVAEELQAELAIRLAAGGTNGTVAVLAVKDGSERVVFYLVTPAVWGWIVRAMRSAESACRSGVLDEATFGAASEQFEAIRTWATARYPAEVLAAAELAKTTLPEIPLPNVTAPGARPPYDETPEARSLAVADYLWGIPWADVAPPGVVLSDGHGWYLCVEAELLESVDARKRPNP